MNLRRRKFIQFLSKWPATSLHRMHGDGIDIVGMCDDSVWRHYSLDNAIYLGGLRMY